MKKDIRQIYKVNKSDVEQSFDKQMGLKMNPEYEEWANNLAVQIIEYFTNKYKGVEMEIPKLREKSPRSLLGKIKNLQIERLSELYAVEGITNNNKRELYSLIEERINENNNLNKDNIMKCIQELLFTKKINIRNFEKEIIINGISNSTKMALLRILISKIEKSKYINKLEAINVLDKKYGAGFAQRTGEPEDDIIKYDHIIELRNNPEKIKSVKDKNEFLKANDLRGMKIVVVDIPDDLKTENTKINELLEKRKNTVTQDERKKYTHEIIVELGKEFYNDLETNESFQQKFNMDILENSRKHKIKKNGYEAEHIKFVSSIEPEYRLEMQFKSEYVENNSRGSGKASHENRPGKLRILPNSNNNAELMRKINFMVPKYTTFIYKNGYIVAQKQTELNNIMAYFQDQIDFDSEDYKRIYELYSNYNNQQQIAM